MIEFTDQVNLQAEIIAARVFLDHFGDTVNIAGDPNSCDTLRDQISKAEISLIFEEKTRDLQAIKEALKNPRKELSLADKQIYYLQLQSRIKNEEAKWKKNAIIIALFCAVFFAGWIYLNTLLFLCLPPAFFFLGFQIILTLNLFLIKGLKTANVHKDSLETELFYNHVTLYKEIALALKQLSVQYYNPSADLDDKIKNNTTKLLAIIADLLRFPQNPAEAFQIGQHVLNHKRSLAQIFIAIFHDPENKNYLWIFKKFIPRLALAQLLNLMSIEDEDKVKEQENKAYFLALLQNFAQETGHNFENLKVLFENKHWYKLFDTLLLKA